MGKTKELFQRMMEEEILGEETRAYVAWLEEEEYQRYQTTERNEKNKDV